MVKIMTHKNGRKATLYSSEKYKNLSSKD